MSKLSPEQWAEIRSMFEQSSALPPEQRGAFLEEKCADEEVRREVRSLLEYWGADSGTLAAEISAEIAEAARETDPDHRLIGSRLGAYRVEAIVGHGGMGAVYRAARDDAEFHQQVAIKLVRPAMQSAEAFERFKRERQILARLAHPHIARLLDGGSTPDGVPYLVMEFIEGEVLTAWCRRQSLSIDQRLRLFLQVCEGVAFAHEHLVVHRDLKPGNILVTAEGTAKLLDFGIAKMLSPEADEATATTLGTQAMTPEYAAPEQVRGEPVSKAVDVYALGLVLYELLTGQKAQAIPDPSPSTVARVICETEPVAPAILQPALAGDLDNIIRMAMRKEPERRYGSAADLARDIRMHLESRPVAARPDTLAYRTAKFVRRNRAMLSGTLAATMVFGGLALGYWVTRPGPFPRVTRVTQLTLNGNADPRLGLAANRSHVYFVERRPGQFKLARVAVGGGTPEVLPSQFQLPEILQISPDRGELLVSDGASPTPSLWGVPTGGGVARRLVDGVGRAAAWSPDGQSIAFARGSALFMVHGDGSGARKLVDIPGMPENLEWAPNARIVRFALVPPATGATTLWEVQADGSHLRQLPLNWDSGTATSGANDSGTWIADGKYYLFRSKRLPVYSLWALQEGGRWLGVLDRPPVLIHSTAMGMFRPAPSADSKRIFFMSGHERSEFVRYDAQRREFVPFLPGKPGRYISVSHDGRWAAYTIPPQETLWRSRVDGSEAVQLTPPSVSVFEPHWSPDDAWILFYGSQPDQTGTGGVYMIPSHGGTAERLTPKTSHDDFGVWSPDGGSVLYRHYAPPRASGAGLYLMDWKTRTTRFLPGSEEMIWSAWSPDARYIAATDRSQIWIFDRRTERWTVVGRGRRLVSPHWSRSGRYVYYQDYSEPEQPIYRVSIDSRKIERMMSSQQIPQSDVSGYLMTGLTPDDAPIGSVVRTNSDVYALELELP